jgi:hypothetical protein
MGFISHLSYFTSQVKQVSVLREVHSLTQTDFSKGCDPELPPSTSSIFLLSLGNLRERNCKFMFMVSDEDEEMGVGKWSKNT